MIRLAEIRARLAAYRTDIPYEARQPLDYAPADLAYLIAEVERLQARCANDDVTLDLNERACAAIGKLPQEALDEACARVKAERDEARDQSQLLQRLVDDAGARGDAIAAERDEALAEIAAYQGRPEGALNEHWTPCFDGFERRIGPDCDESGALVRWLIARHVGGRSPASQWVLELRQPHARLVEAQPAGAFVDSLRAAMRLAEADAEARGWLS